MEKLYNWENNPNISTKNTQNTINSAANSIVTSPNNTPKNKLSKFLSKHTLSIILTIMILIILSLATVIIINKLNEDDTYQTTNDASIEDTASNTPSLGEQTYEKAKQIITSDVEDPYEATTTYFNDLLSTYTDPQDIFSIESVHVTILIESNYYNEALPIIDKLQTLAANDEQLITVYSYYSTVYGHTCENADKSKEYNEKAQELINKTQENW